MRENRLLSTTHGLVALALALGLLLALPFDGIARPDLTTGALRGIARVVDGDTIDIGDTRIRLEGIDAPETGQTCKRKWFGSWPCGAVATTAPAWSRTAR
jgi:endonuclease YncB( thermonuclease family)